MVGQIDGRRKNTLDMLLIERKLDVTGIQLYMIAILAIECI